MFLKKEDVYGPVNCILANYLLWRIKVQLGSPDRDAFADELLSELERGK